MLPSSSQGLRKQAGGHPAKRQKVAAGAGRAAAGKGKADAGKGKGVAKGKGAVKGKGTAKGQGKVRNLWPCCDWLLVLLENVLQSLMI